MREERTVWVDDRPYIVVLSDEKKTLLAAQAAGRVIVGVLQGEMAAEQVSSLGSAVRYLVETPETADERYLERVVRRTLGLPWIIAQTERLIVREFTVTDISSVPHEGGDTEADMVFYTPELLAEYIRCQYGFFEYGIWALVEKKSGRLIGKAGVTGADNWMRGAVGAVAGGECLELGYHIFEPYRRQGYAIEACQAIMEALGEDLAEESEQDTIHLCARADMSNVASIRVLKSCGFQFVSQSDGFSVFTVKN